MLHLIPRPLHRLLYRIAHFGRRKWLGWRGGTVHGASMIARDAQGRVLLVRHAYGSDQWCFPGGRIVRGEDPAVAAVREFREELGCGVRDLVFLGQIREPFHGAENRVELFTALVEGEPQPDGRELTHAAFFALDRLPPDLAITVPSRIGLLKQG